MYKKSLSNDIYVFSLLYCQRQVFFSNLHRSGLEPVLEYITIIALYTLH